MAILHAAHFQRVVKYISNLTIPSPHFSHTKVKLGVISTYVRAASTPWVLLALVSLLVNVGGMVGTNIWLSAWSNDAARSVNGTETVDVGVRLGVYSALGMTQSKYGYVEYAMGQRLGSYVWLK